MKKPEIRLESSNFQQLLDLYSIYLQAKVLLDGKAPDGIKMPATLSRKLLKEVLDEFEKKWAKPDLISEEKPKE